MDRKDDRDLNGRDPSGRVLSVHLGRSANCSSVGSVVDVLFMSSVAGTAILGALAVYLGGRAETRTDAEAEAETAKETDADAGEERS